MTKRILRIGACALAAAALVAACNIGLPPADVEDTSGDGSQVSFSLARAYTQTGSIGSAGGILSTTDANGVVYALDIPANALLAEEPISITPVSAATGLPLSGGLVAALHLEPSGLQLMQPATLTLTPPQDLDVPAAVSFAYSGDGTQLRLYPAASLQRPIRLVISHFCGYGVGYGSPGELPPPVGTEAQYEHEVAGAATYDENGDLQLTEELTDAVENQLLSWWDETIYPNLSSTASGSDLDAFIQAVNAFLGWQKQVYLAEDLLGLGPTSLLADQVDTGWDLIRAGIENLRAVARDRCVNHHELHQIKALLRLERIVDLLGIGEPISLAELLEDCLRFELDVDVTVDRVLSGLIDGGHYDWWVSSMRTILTVPLAWSPEEGCVWGWAEGPFDIESYEYAPEFDPSGGDWTCSVDYHRSDPESDSVLALLLLPLNEGGDEIEDIGIWFQALGPQIHWEWSCTDGDQWASYTLDLLGDNWGYGLAFAALGAGDVEPFEGATAPVYRGWNILGGAEYATRSIFGSHRIEPGDGSGAIYHAADGTMTLRHTPTP